MTETIEEWVIVWFPPEADRSRKFRREQAARDFAATEEVAQWHPLMEHRRTTTSVESELVPLPKPTGSEASRG